MSAINLRCLLRPVIQGSIRLASVHETRTLCALGAYLIESSNRTFHRSVTDDCLLLLIVKEKLSISGSGRSLPTFAEKSFVFFCRKAVSSRFPCAVSVRRADVRFREFSIELTNSTVRESCIPSNLKCNDPIECSQRILRFGRDVFLEIFGERIPEESSAFRFNAFHAVPSQSVVLEINLRVSNE